MKFLTYATAFLLAVVANASPVEIQERAPVCKLYCPEGTVCVTLPEKPYTQVCIKPVFCGGFAAIQCEDKGMRCIDDPYDDCDPLKGGADCGGLCAPYSLYE